MRMECQIEAPPAVEQRRRRAAYVFFVFFPLPTRPQKLDDHLCGIARLFQRRLRSKGKAHPPLRLLLAPAHREHDVRRERRVRRARRPARTGDAAQIERADEPFPAARKGDVLEVGDAFRLPAVDARLPVERR